MTHYPEANKRRGGRVKVRGTCTAGHVTETTSDPGRITWDGECAADGCSNRVHAKRVPVDARPPETPEGAHVVDDEQPDDHETVREVSYDHAPPKRRGERPGSAVPGSGAPGAPEVRDVDELTPGTGFTESPPEQPDRGIVDTRGPELVDQTPRRRERPRERERYAFALPWERGR